MKTTLANGLAACAAVLVLILSAFTPASAQVTVGASGVGSSYNIFPGKIFAQVVTVPADVTTLSTFSLHTYGVISPGTVVNLHPEVYAWTGSEIGARLNSINDPVLVYSSGLEQTLTFTTSGVSVTPGQKIVVAARIKSPDAQFYLTSLPSGVEGYAEGFRISKNDGYPSLTQGQNIDMVFSATFLNVPPPPPIPTMTEWAMILFGVLLAGAATVKIRRQRLA